MDPFKNTDDYADKAPSEREIRSRQLADLARSVGFIVEGPLRSEDKRCWQIIFRVGKEFCCRMSVFSPIYIACAYSSDREVFSRVFDTPELALAFAYAHFILKDGAVSSSVPERVAPERKKKAIAQSAAGVEISDFI